MKSEKRAQIKSWYVFIAAGITLSIALALFLSPFASTSPDGLEKVASDKGFIEKAEGTEPVWDKAPLPDYSIPRLEESHPAWATALSGLLGTITVLLVAWGVALLLRKKTTSPGGYPQQSQR
jgi:cobalt/nickel transport protein